MNKRLKELNKTGMTLVGTGIGLGVGASAITEAGGNATGVTRLAAGMKPIAGVAVGKTLLDITYDLVPKRKGKKYR